jgi:hypothetical protein
VDYVVTFSALEQRIDALTGVTCHSEIAVYGMDEDGSWSPGGPALYKFENQPFVIPRFPLR